MPVDFVSDDAIRRIASDVFGGEAAVSCIRQITASKNHGITETPPSTRNLLYVVDIEGHPRSYVFRFSRVEDDVYEQEAANYALLAQETGVRVPTIYRLDTSGEVVPTSYMVMDYLPGKLWNYLAHPENPQTTDSDKRAIEETIGRFYAQVHDIKREVHDPSIEEQTMLYTIDRLQAAAEQDNVRASPEEIARCRGAIRDEPTFCAKELSLCLADSEIHVAAKQNGKWAISFVCDAEWIEYRHPFADLTQKLAGPLPWWRLEQAATNLDPEEVAARPFFRGYDPDGKLDYRKLLRLAAFYQLGLWAYVAMTSHSPDKKRWIREDKGPLIQELVRQLCERPVGVER